MLTLVVLADCTAPICREPLHLAEALILWLVYFVLAVRTSALAGKLDRGQTAWFLYGLCVPLISYVHIKLIERRYKSGGPPS